MIASTPRITTHRATLADTDWQQATEAMGQAEFGVSFDERVYDSWLPRFADTLYVACFAGTRTVVGYADQLVLAPAMVGRIKAAPCSSPSSAATTS